MRRVRGSAPPHLQLRVSAAQQPPSGRTTAAAHEPAHEPAPVRADQTSTWASFVRARLRLHACSTGFTGRQDGLRVLPGADVHVSAHVGVHVGWILLLDVAVHVLERKVSKYKTEFD